MSKAATVGRAWGYSATSGRDFVLVALQMQGETKVAVDVCPVLHFCYPVRWFRLPVCATDTFTTETTPAWSSGF